jgi:hypothetical protein
MVSIFSHITLSSLVLALVVAARGGTTIEIARSFPDGGGYQWKGTGVPEEILFKGERILAKGERTYCSGFTFAVVMKAAAERRLLQDKSVEQVRRFQKQWYGATEESSETQCAYAVEALGIGRSVSPEEAQPGDFLQLWRTNGSGHSVLFLDWVVQDGRRIGVKYRSSQTATNGIGDHTEYFVAVAEKNGKVDPQRLYFARLHDRASRK